MSHVLKLSNGEERYHLAAHKYGKTDMEVVLPEGVTCSQCVFRWKWITETTGFEQFVGCSDISISPREGSLVTVAPDTPKPTQPMTEAPETEAPETEAPETEAPVTEALWTEAPETEAPLTEAPETEAPWTEAPETEAPLTEAPETEAPVTEAPVPHKPWEPLVHDGRVQLMCRGVDVWKTNAEMAEWCNNNCNNAQYNCPSSLCHCWPRM